jgi:hypothetical protein
MISIKHTVEKNFGGRFLRRSAVGLREGEMILASFVQNKGYKTILEIGTYLGFSTAVLAQHCEKIITVDLVDGRLEDTFGKFDRTKLWSDLGLNNIEQLLVKDNHDKYMQLKDLEYDFAFIDGDHGPDMIVDWLLVNKCKNVLFHDYDISNRTGLNYVYTLVNSLPQNEVQIIDVFAHWQST